jgi:hypothetical protein
MSGALRLVCSLRQCSATARAHDAPPQQLRGGGRFGMAQRRRQGSATRTQAMGWRMDVYRKPDGQTSRRVTYRNLGEPLRLPSATFAAAEACRTTLSPWVLVVAIGGNSWRMDFEASDTSVRAQCGLLGGGGSTRSRCYRV